MDLIIGFYSKEEVFVDISFPQNDSSEKRTELELFLLAWYTLQTIHNLGSNPVVSLFEGIFLLKDANKFHDHDDPLPYFRNYNIGEYIMGAYIASHKSAVYSEYKAARKKLTNQYLIDVLKQEIFSIYPKLITKSSITAEKSFIGKVPPYTIQQNGFGLFGKDINYYACYSIIALMNKVFDDEKREQTGLKPDDEVENMIYNILFNCAIINERGLIKINNQPKLASELVETIKKNPNYKME